MHSCRSGTHNTLSTLPPNLNHNTYADEYLRVVVVGCSLRSTWASPVYPFNGRRFGVSAFWRVVVIVVGASKRPLKALGAWRVVGGRLSTRSEASVDGESSAQFTGLFEMLLVSVSPSKNLTYNFRMMKSFAQRVISEQIFQVIKHGYLMLTGLKLWSSSVAEK
jgi:hypothetical protein